VWWGRLVRGYGRRRPARLALSATRYTWRSCQPSPGGPSRDQPVLLGYAAAIWVFFAAWVRWVEEPTLSDQFGAQYEAYRRGVPDADIAALFSVSRPTVYRSLERIATLAPRPADTWPVPDVGKYGLLLTPKDRATRRRAGSG
jgi:hypothetical protein